MFPIPPPPKDRPKAPFGCAFAVGFLLVVVLGFSFCSAPYRLVLVPPGGAPHG